MEETDAVNTSTGAEDAGTAESTSVDENTDVDYGDMSLDELLEADLSDDPIMGQEHKNLPHYTEILKHVPENARKLVSNLRADATRKTQALAEARRELEQERAALLREKEALYSGDFARRVNEVAAQETKDLDLYDEAGLQKRIEVETARRLRELIQPMQEQMQVQQRQAQLDTFRSQHPDLMEPSIKTAVVKELTDRPEIRLEDAYHIVKGRLASAENARLQSEHNSKRATQRQVLERTGGRSPVGGLKPPQSVIDEGAYAVFQWHKSQGVK